MNPQAATAPPCPQPAKRGVPPFAPILPPPVVPQPPEAFVPSKPAGGALV